MKRASLLAVLVLAGCGGTAHPRTAPPKPPHIPLALAQSLEAQANAVAQSLAAGDGCTALQQANALRDAVAQSRAEIPARLRPTLEAVVEQLPGRITCNPAPPPPPDHGHGKDHGKHKGHGGDEG